MCYIKTCREEHQRNSQYCSINPGAVDTIAMIPVLERERDRLDMIQEQRMIAFKFINTHTYHRPHTRHTPEGVSILPLWVHCDQSETVESFHCLFSSFRHGLDIWNLLESSLVGQSHRFSACVCTFYPPRHSKFTPPLKLRRFNTHPPSSLVSTAAAS